MINNGSVVAVCDEKVEIRDTTIEEINEKRDNLVPIACTPEDDNCGDDDFDEEWQIKLILFCKCKCFVKNDIKEIHFRCDITLNISCMY